MTLGEKASYIKGMLEGLDLDKEKKENKILISVVELLEEMADSILDLENRVDDIDDQTEDILDKFENISCSTCECEDEDKHGHHNCHGCSESDSSDDFYYEIQCPACSTTICLSETAVLEKDINCPNCGQEIEIDLENSDLSSENSDKKSSDSDSDSSDSSDK